MASVYRRGATALGATVFVALWHALQLPYRQELSAVAWIGTSALAAVCCLRAGSRLTGRDRLVWWLFAGVGFGWAGANVAFSYHELVLHRPALAPSLVDAGYAVAVSCGLVAGAIAFLGMVRQGAARMRVLIDVVISVSACAYVLFALVLEDAIASSSSGSWTAITWVWPITEMGITGFAGALMVRSTPRHRLTWL